ADANAQLTAVVDRYSFNVGLSHPHLYDGLSRRTMTRGHRGSLLLRCRAPSSPPPCRSPGAPSAARSALRPPLRVTATRGSALAANKLGRSPKPHASSRQPPLNDRTRDT